MLLIKEIPNEKIRQKAVDNCIKLLSAKDEKEALDLELVHAFNWRKTDQGHQFWSNINKLYS